MTIDRSLFFLLSPFTPNAAAEFNEWLAVSAGREHRSPLLWMQSVSWHFTDDRISFGTSQVAHRLPEVSDPSLVKYHWLMIAFLSASSIPQMLRMWWRTESRAQLFHQKWSSLLSWRLRQVNKWISSLCKMLSIYLTFWLGKLNVRCVFHAHYTGNNDSWALPSE